MDLAAHSQVEMAKNYLQLTHPTQSAGELSSKNELTTSADLSETSYRASFD